MVSSPKVPPVCGTYPMPSRRPLASTGRPPMARRPSRTRICPAIAFSSVDLPAPLWPASITISPSPTESDTPLTTVRLP
jgi:hypothetical protein